jgi:hypothetical protein
MTTAPSMSGVETDNLRVGACGRRAAPPAAALVTIPPLSRSLPAFRSARPRTVTGRGRRGATSAGQGAGGNGRGEKGE